MQAASRAVTSGTRPRPALLLFPILTLSVTLSWAESDRFQFVNVAAQAGLTQPVHAGRPGKDHLLDSAGTGVAWLDYDRDGHLDIFLANGWRVADRQVVEKGTHRLYRNQGDGQFEDVTEKAGVGGQGHWGSGVAVADYDADGWPDILVTHFGPTVLFRNTGKGSFENVADKAGIESPGWNTGAAFLDFDGDGDLDLYVASYISCSLQDVLHAERTLNWKGMAQVALGPFGLLGAADHFFRSDGRGNFEDVTEQTELTDRSLGFGFAVRAADFDNDGDLDIYVANDSDANYYYRNEGNGTFREIGLWNGTGLDANGAAQAGMGVAVGDVDLDGGLDIFVTNFAEDSSTLYRSLGEGFFEDSGTTSGVGGLTFQPLSWGTALSDLDNDGDLDIVIANGHIYPQVDEHAAVNQSYHQLNQLLENQGRGRFLDVTEQAGSGFAVRKSSRGLAVGDYDNDGDLDVLIGNLDEPPSLLRNDSRTGHWLIIACEVPAGSGTAIGTRVRVTVGEKTWIRDVSSSGSFLSVHDPRLHFGLGSARQVHRIEVRWPDGTTTTLTDIPAGQVLRIRKGTGS